MSKQSSKKQNKDLSSSGSFLFGLFINYFKPSSFVTNIKEINLDKIKEQNIKLIICDLDNTLVPHFTKFPTKLAFDFVKEVKKRNFHFVLISNNVKKRVSFFSEKLNLETYVYNAKKPFTHKINEVIKKYGVKPSETLIIGDMLITDVLAANFVGAESILVQPIMEADKFLNSILTFLEEKVYKKLSKENILYKQESLSESIYSQKYDIL